jgi:2-(1,2-epoxy-1,2-dihydrophenyl)acetyl-CoA isomerase
MSRWKVLRMSGKYVESKLPPVAAVQGAAIGGGLGLTLAADFRAARAESRSSVDPPRVGSYHGFEVAAATEYEHAEQSRLPSNNNRAGGVRAYAERRMPMFTTR